MLLRVLTWRGAQDRTCARCPPGTFLNRSGSVSAADCVECQPGEYAAEPPTRGANISCFGNSNCPCSAQPSGQIEGTISDGSGAAAQYESDMYCEYLIASPHASSISLRFTAFDVEAEFDTVVLYSCSRADCSGGSSERRLLATLSGTSQAYLETIYTADAGALLLIFQSDQGTEAAGWEAIWWMSNADSSGARACSTCVAGTYAAQASASACLLCGPGTYASRPGSTACHACGPSTPWLDGTYATEAAHGASSCFSCPPNEWYDYWGALAPEPNPQFLVPGLPFAEQHGCVQCQGCADGFYRVDCGSVLEEVPSSGSCQACPPNSTSVGNSAFSPDGENVTHSHMHLCTWKDTTSDKKGLTLRSIRARTRIHAVRCAFHTHSHVPAVGVLRVCVSCTCCVCAFC